MTLQAPDGSSGFAVDLQGLHDFGVLLRADIDATLRSGGDQIAKTFKWGGCFGRRSASHEVQAAAVRYHACLEGSTQLMADYVRLGEALAQAAAAIAEAYRDTDAMAAASAHEVQRRLDAAMYQAEQADQARQALAARQAKLAAEREAQFLQTHGMRA